MISRVQFQPTQVNANIDANNDSKKICSNKNDMETIQQKQHETTQPSLVE